MLFVAALLASIAIVRGQSSLQPVLENTGPPLKVSAECTAEKVQTLNLNCTDEDPCSLFLELTTVAGVGNRLFLTGNLHTAGTTVESILLSSDNAGKTWTEAFERLPGTGLEGIQFHDFETGWIGGQSLGTLPRDPFFLLTTDGGKTWRRQPVSGESRIGAIGDFYFDSRTSGTLVLDRMQSGESGMRHELYETMTGGSSWMLRAVNSKPLQIKKPLAAEREWRVNADARSKSYRVERNSAGKWQPVVSFLIAAGECRTPPPPGLPEPLVPEPDSVTEIVVPDSKKPPSLTRPGKKAPAAK